MRCARVTSTFWPHTIPKNLQNSYSRYKRIATRLCSSNFIRLLTRCGMYMPDMKCWDRKVADTDFIQTAYQRRLQTGTMTSAQGVYATNNRFVGLTADDDVSDDGTAKMIFGLINLHMANLSAQMATSGKTVQSLGVSLISPLCLTKIHTPTLRL